MNNSLSAKYPMMSDGYLRVRVQCPEFRASLRGKDKLKAELAVAAALDQPQQKRQRASGKKCDCGKAAQAADCSFCKGCCVARMLNLTIEHPQCMVLV